MDMSWSQERDNREENDRTGRIAYVSVCAYPFYFFLNELYIIICRI